MATLLGRPNDVRHRARAVDDSPRRILLMDNGRIVERGTHEQLMSAGGVYHDMVRRQMESQRGEEVLN